MKKATPEQKKDLEELQALLARYRTAQATHDALQARLDSQPPSIAGRIFQRYRLALATVEGKSLCSSLQGLAQLRDLFYANLLPGWSQRDA